MAKGVKLMDANYTIDETIAETKVQIKDIIIGTTKHHMLQFGEVPYYQVFLGLSFIDNLLCTVIIPKIIFSV